jgi:hypothetical protein
MLGVASANSHDATYSGERILTNGATPYCVGPESVTAVITGSMLKFTNSEWRDLPMQFDPRLGGSLGGAFEDPSGYVVIVRGEVSYDVPPTHAINSRCVRMEVFHFGTVARS